jgi:hypothetical protein
MDAWGHDCMIAWGYGGMGAWDGGEDKDELLIVNG